ncbi:YbaB/EbfC family nucleoid-associated protein [Nocardia sp. NPDC050175]|uniref:YbaB/EbfC family nucleoid-associated protein n=1 Tax=Nocardia sp. NPDC050175 TaxID=3364317 RepID=UPI0037A7BE0C
MSHPSHDELGLKVQRAQYELAQIRGVGKVDGVRVEVDADNRLVSISVPNAERILAAYEAAVLDKQPQVEEAMRELTEDPQVSSARIFADANAARLEGERRGQDAHSTGSGRFESGW